MLAVLAMLAVMATSFITLMRLDVRIARNYTDDQRCELLAYGMVNYFRALLREDLDRTWGRYENRDTGIGFYSRVYKGTGAPDVSMTQIPGIIESTWGTPVSNDVWFSAPWTTWGDSGGDIYSYISGYYGVTQQSFAWNDKYGSALGTLGRYKAYVQDPSTTQYNARWIYTPEADVWVGLASNCRDQGGRVVAENYVGGGTLTPIDDDGDGVANPEYFYPETGPNAFSRENAVLYGSLYDQVPFVMAAGPTGFQPGKPITGESALPGGLYWRWGVKIGPTHSTYANLNVAGNLDGLDSQWLGSMGGLSGVRARRAADERLDTFDSGRNAHLGRIEWEGFPDFYDSVMYHPASASLERLFHRGDYNGVTGSPSLPPNVGLDRELARNLIRYRWGNGTGRPGGGQNRRVGWRRDGATYFKFPSPENPLDNDRYFGANEVIEHDHSVDNPSTSAVARILGDVPWRTVRPFVTMWSTDTILRGKIWPTEGPPYTSAQGDWRHIDILKRVNINLIGASGPEGLAGEDSALKSRWVGKRDHERDRLYYMLMGAFRFSVTGGSAQACQFIASLADMVDRDNDETFYQAPDGTGAWGLGVEKHPVLNEIVFYSNGFGNAANYNLYRFRVELYNPCENIPWIPDQDEAYDITDYVIKIGPRAYRVGALHKYSASSANADLGEMDLLANKKIGADGLFGVPIAGWVPGNAEDPSWTRYVHLGWTGATVADGEWPKGLTRTELQGGSDPAAFTGVDVSLWQPLRGDAAVRVPVNSGKVEDLTVVGGGSGRYLCVDMVAGLKLVRPWVVSRGENGPGHIVNDQDYDPAHGNPDTALNRSEGVYLSDYRRWDPMNARCFVQSGAPDGKADQDSLIWCPGYNLGNFPTLGRPNLDYKAKPYSTAGSTTTTTYQYRRLWERNFKVVDGDLPSIGWLGELMMWNRAIDGPLTLVHTTGQDPSKTVAYREPDLANKLDLRAKFDLYRPFTHVGTYSPDTATPDPTNPDPAKTHPNGLDLRVTTLHILDCFTVWDPSNDGIDNDGDGAVDDEDTGRQPGDKGGPEVRVFGQIDLNQMPQEVWATVWPDNKDVRTANKSGYVLSFGAMMRQMQRRPEYDQGIGPFETIGDLIRADAIQRYPGTWLGGSWWSPGGGTFDEYGFTKFSQYQSPYPGDDDGDGIYDERDERDMMFTWMANHYTTRDNVFEIDLNVQLCEPPFHPTDSNGGPIKLPFKAYKTSRSYARKQVLGILDRSGVLRVNPNGTCDFTGPVELRMLRVTDDVKVY